MQPQPHDSIGPRAPDCKPAVGIGDEGRIGFVFVAGHLQPNAEPKHLGLLAGFCRLEPHVHSETGRLLHFHLHRHVGDRSAFQINDLSMNGPLGHEFEHNLFGLFGGGIPVFTLRPESVGDGCDPRTAARRPRPVERLVFGNRDREPAIAPRNPPSKRAPLRESRPISAQRQHAHPAAGLPSGKSTRPRITLTSALLSSTAVDAGWRTDAAAGFAAEAVVFARSAMFCRLSLISPRSIVCPAEIVSLSASVS